MKVEVVSKFEIGDKVIIGLDRDAIIVDVKWHEQDYVFCYLVERQDRTRVWAYEDSLKGSIDND